MQIINDADDAVDLDGQDEIARLIFEHHPAAIAVLDRHLRYIAVSKKWIEDYRLHRQQVIGLHHYEMFPDVPDRWKALHQRALAGEVLSCEEDPFPRADGRTDWVKWMIRPWHNGKQTIGGIIIFSEVITRMIEERAALKNAGERYKLLSTANKNAELALEQEAEWLRFLTNAMDRLWKISQLSQGLEEVLSTAITLLNANIGIIYLWDEVTRSLRVEAHRGATADLLALVSDPHSQLYELCLSAFRWRRQYAIEDVQNDERFVYDKHSLEQAGLHAALLTPLFDRKGDPIGIVSTYSYTPDHFTMEGLRRMTIYSLYVESFLERIRILDEIGEVNHRLEEKVVERTWELTQSLEREKEGNELKSRFVSTASHEFRTPLSTILSSVGLAEKYIELQKNEATVRHMMKIREAVNHLIEILDDFLSLDKLESGKIKAEKSSFDLRILLDDVIAEMEAVKKDGQVLSLHCDQSVMIHQDRKILRNILYNLLSNAIKYSADHKPILIRVALSPSGIMLSVRDEGMGIPYQEQKHMFSRLFRASNASAIAGTGLGLNITRMYTELIGGQIGFTSVPGSGTTFLVSLPVK